MVIQVIEKPDWVSWEVIHQVLWNAHEENRQKGIMMQLPSLSAEELHKYIGEGKILHSMPRPF